MTDPDQDGASSPSRNLVFSTTHWSVVMQAGEDHSAEGASALEKLCRTYWFPLYAYIRRKGRTEEDAKDLTQQFFASLLARKDFQTVDAGKGKFRTFLLASLTHFLSNERDRTQAAKRGGGRTLISFDEMTPEQLRRFELTSDLAPDKLFDQRWAMALLETVVTQLRAEMAGDDKAKQFERLNKFLTNEPQNGEYAALATELRSTSQSVAVMVHRMRQRYRELVRAEVTHTVSSPMDVEDEMRHLYAALNGC